MTRTPYGKADGQPALRAAGLVKRYDGRSVLDGVDLEVPSGEVLALLGPNGAGKTTAVRIVATLTRPDAGSVHVAGTDALAQPALARRSIGLVGQDAALDDVLGPRQNLRLFARLHGLSRRAAARRADDLLEEFGLADAADRPVTALSGGMRRRLDLASGLIVRPPLLLLDEPTTGLDPQGRRDIWQIVRRLVAQGTSLLLTTQYLEEADRVAGRVVVLRDGRVVANDSPGALKRAAGGDRIDLVLDSGLDERAVRMAADIAASAGSGPAKVDGRTVTIPAGTGRGLVAAVVGALASHDLEVMDLTVRRPTLDEVYLRLVGAPEEPDPEQVSA